MSGRRRGIPVLAGVLGGLLTLLTACGAKEPTGPTSYFVTYRLSATPSVTFDSVRYEDAQGALVRVLAPARDWFVTFSMDAGGYVQGRAWGLANAGQSVRDPEGDVDGIRRQHGE